MCSSLLTTNLKEATTFICGVCGILHVNTYELDTVHISLHV